MKITPLILLLITGCANWTPDEYYDSPDDKIIDSILYELDENQDENVKLAQRSNELCIINPIGTFGCARY